MSKHVKALRELARVNGRRMSLADWNAAYNAADHLERAEKRLLIASEALRGHASPQAHRDALAEMKAIR